MPNSPNSNSEERLDLTGLRVLTVDDEPDGRELLNFVLRQFGAEVLSVDTAVAALQSLSAFQPDVLISDIGMPDLDGYALIQQIRTLPATQGGRVPAIALTAYARSEDGQRALHSGYQRHLSKPLDPEKLVQAVRSLKSAQG